MILADTSVWIDHFRRGNEDLAKYLNSNSIWTHPFIVGEIACGNLKDRWETLAYFKTLEHVASASHEEVLVFIDMNKLFALGLGYIDAHILAAAKLAGASLWTLDKSLKNAAKILLIKTDI